MMKLLFKIFVFLMMIISIPSFADNLVEETKYVNDSADFLSKIEIKALRTKLKNIESQSGVVISVVTVRDYKSLNRSYNHWREGNASQNGVFFLVNNVNQEINIWVGDKYPEHYNEIMQSIIDETIAPQLKNGKYNKGIQDGVDRIISVITKKASWLAFDNWGILAVIYTIISLFVALSIDQDKHNNNILLLFAFVGTLLLRIFLGDPYKTPYRSSNGCDDSGGASGDS